MSARIERSRGAHTRLTLFVEVLNVLDRTNQRVAIPIVDGLRVTNLFEPLVPLVPSAGLLLEF